MTSKWVVSSVVEHRLHTAGVGGSKPSPPTTSCAPLPLCIAVPFLGTMGVKQTHDEETIMNRALKGLCMAILAGYGGLAVAQNRSLNVICSVQADWCHLVSQVYSRTTGVKMNMTL